MNRYQLRHRDTQLAGLPGWYLDVLRDDDEIEETFTVGDCIRAPYKLPKATHAVICGFYEDADDGDYWEEKVFAKISIPGHPEVGELKVEVEQIEHFSPLERLALEAEDDPSTDSGRI